VVELPAAPAQPAPEPPQPEAPAPREVSARRDPAPAPEPPASDAPAAKPRRKKPASSRARKPATPRAKKPARRADKPPAQKTAAPTETPAPAEAPAPPLRLVHVPAQRQAPVADAPLADAPEFPRLQAEAAPEPPPAPPLADAPEAVLVPPSAEAPEPQAPAAAPARRFARATPWPEDAAQLWTCELDWKAGYLKSTFRAMAAGPGGGKREPLGESSPLKWALNTEPEPPTPALAMRVRGLVEALEAAGWEHIGRGRQWYAQRFLWRGSGEPQPITVTGSEPAER
jgi:hypothetical protein